MRPSWDQYFMQLAEAAATRSTCPRLHVGCVLVRDKHVLSTGYNGSLPGRPHCDDVGCDLAGTTSGCRRTVHAETNAVMRSYKSGSGSVAGATAYVTHQPCLVCMQLLYAAGVAQVLYRTKYRLIESLEWADSVGLPVRQLA